MSFEMHKRYRSLSSDHNVDDTDIVVRFVGFRVGFHVAHLLHHLHAFGNAPKHRVLVIQPRLECETTTRVIIRSIRDR